MCTSLHSFSTFSNTQTNNSHSPHTAWPYAEDKSKWSIQKTGKKMRHTNQDDGKSSRKKGTLFEISHTQNIWPFLWVHFVFMSSICSGFFVHFFSYHISLLQIKSTHNKNVLSKITKTLHLLNNVNAWFFFLLKFFSPFYSSLFRIIRLNFQIYWKKCLIFWIANSEHRFSHSQICRNNVSRSVLNATDR